MRVLAITYQEDAGPGVFADAVGEREGRLETWLVPEKPDPPGKLSTYDAVMTFGGAMHADQEEDHPWLRTQKQLHADLIESGTPLLGACLGAQLLCVAAGGQVRRMEEPEIGWTAVEATADGAADPLLGPMAPEFSGFNWHSYECLPPAGAAVLAASRQCIQAYRVGERVWGIQFHAEVSAADAGKWIDDWREDEDAVRAGIDPEALRAETRKAIASWNETGRELCGRFLDAIAVSV